MSRLRVALRRGQALGVAGRVETRFRLGDLRPCRRQGARRRGVRGDLGIQQAMRSGRPARASSMRPRSCVELGDPRPRRGERLLAVLEAALVVGGGRRDREVAGELVDADAERRGIRAAPPRRSRPPVRPPRPRRPLSRRRRACAVVSMDARSVSAASARSRVRRSAAMAAARSSSCCESHAGTSAELLLLAQRLRGGVRRLGGAVGSVGGISLAHQRLGPVGGALRARARRDRIATRSKAVRPRSRSRRRPRSARRPRPVAPLRRAGGRPRRRRRPGRARPPCDAARARSGSPRTCACRTACAAGADDRRCGPGGTRRNGPARAGSPAGTAADSARGSRRARARRRPGERPDRARRRRRIRRAERGAARS